MNHCKSSVRFITCMGLIRSWLWFGRHGIREGRGIGAFAGGGVGGVEAGPDYDADVEVDEEFGEEEVAKVVRELIS